MSWYLHELDCRLAMSMMMDEASVDAIVTDPPYGLSKEPDMVEVLTHWLTGDDYTHGGSGFMGKTWDSFVPGPAVWREAYRVLKPGGHLVAFFGTRTYDLGVLAIRMAGFEIRDQIAWVYGSGFPKSHDVSKGIDKIMGLERAIVGPNKFAHLNGSANLNCYGDASRPPETAPASPEAAKWQGWGTALKPAFEPIVVARKPLEGTVAANVLAHGTGAINIDACRVGTENTRRAGDSSRMTSAGISGGSYGNGGYVRSENSRTNGSDSGRWPANLAHDGSDEVLAGFPTTSSGKMKAGTQRAAQDGPGSVCYGTYGGPATNNDTFGDSGSAARFFKTCELGDEDWLAQNLPRVIANIADNHLSLQNLFDAFVQSHAVTSALPGCMVSITSTTDLRSTNATLSESKSVCEMLTQMILFLESAFLQESPPTKLSLSLNHAHFVASLTPIGITLTMTDLWLSSGFAEPITFCITPKNLVLGVPGSAQSSARFKYCAKASKADRNEGLDELPDQMPAASEFRPNHAEKAAEGEDGNPYGRWSPTKNIHPTVKPTDLMRWLVRLVTPPGGVVLDPFTGSGSTGKAALLEGFDFIGCEMTPEYAEIAKRRLDHASRSR